MKYSSLSLLTSSVFFITSLSPNASWAQTSEASLLQRIEAQTQRIAQLEAELTQLRQQIGLAQPAADPPAPPAPPKTPAPQSGKNYVVQQGETLSAIARKHQVSISELTAANQLSTPDQLQLGQTIIIPGTGSSVPGSPPVSTPTPQSTPAPAAPAAPAKTVAYTVRKGDTLSSIARDHGSSISAIVTENGLADPNSLTLGQNIRIPGATKTVASTGQTAASDSGQSSYGQREFPSGYAYYTVIPGDTIYSIARVFGTSQQELERLNGFSAGASIRPNQQILVPMDHYSGPYRTS